MRTYVLVNVMHSHRLQSAWENLAAAIHQMEAALEELRAEHDPLASHIFVSRRRYQNIPDTKGGKRHETAARLSWQQACDLGFRGDLREWEPLLGVAYRAD